MHNELKCLHPASFAETKFLLVANWHMSLWSLYLLWKITMFSLYYSKSFNYFLLWYLCLKDLIYSRELEEEGEKKNKGKIACLFNYLLHTCTYVIQAAYPH